MFFAAWKINILKAKNGGRWKRMFDFNWVTFWVPACNFQGCILGLHNTFRSSWFHSMATWRFVSGQKSQTEQVHLPIVIHRMKIIPAVRRPSDHFEQVSHDKNLHFLKPLLNLHTLALPFKVLSSPAPKLRRDRKVKMDRKGFCSLCFGLELWIWWRSQWKKWMMNSLLQTKRYPPKVCLKMIFLYVIVSWRISGVNLAICLQHVGKWPKAQQSLGRSLGVGWWYFWGGSVWVKKNNNNRS